MSLDSVAHQASAQRLVQRAVTGNRVPHAYLFHGPDGVGKERFALSLAALLLCDKPVEREIEPARVKTVGVERLRTGCGQCHDCRAVATQTHPDLHLIYRQLNREHPEPEVRKRKALDIGVDVIRHFVIEKVGLTPNLGRAKVFILREADRMTVQAQNALLKTLEEPPGTTFIILLVTAMDLLLPTTLSRCQVVRFDALPLQYVRGELQGMLSGLSAEQVEWYARCSDGSLGRALEWAGDELSGSNERLLEGLSRFSASNRAPERKGSSTRSAPGGTLVGLWTEESKALGERYRKRDPDITDTEAGRRGLKAVFQLAAGWYADLLRVASGNRDAIVNTRWRTQIEVAGGSIESRQAIDAVNRIARAEHQLDLNANTQLCLEALLADLARTSRNGIP